MSDAVDREILELLRKQDGEAEGTSASRPSADELVAFAFEELDGAEHESMLERLSRDPESARAALDIRRSAGLGAMDPEPEADAPLLGEEGEEGWQRLQARLSEIREEEKTVSELATDLPAIKMEAIGTEGIVPTPEHRADWRPWALAAILALACFGLSTWNLVLRRADPAVGVTTGLEIFTFSSRTRSEPVQVPASSGLVLVIPAELLPSASTEKPLEAELRREGERLWRGELAPLNALGQTTLVIRPELIRPAPYELEVFGAPDGASSVFRFDIRGAP